MKKDSQGKLNDLTAAVADELDRLCRSKNKGGEGYTLRQGVQWLARHHKVKTSINQLSRWLGRRRTDGALYDMIARIQRHDVQATAITRVVLNAPATQEAINRLIHDMAFLRLSKGEEVDPDALETAVRLHLEARKIALKEREVQLDERKLKRLEDIEAQAAEAKKQLQSLRAKGGGMSPDALTKLERAIKLL